MKISIKWIDQYIDFIFDLLTIFLMFFKLYLCTVAIEWKN